MNPQAQRCLELETEFIAGVQANLEQARGQQLVGTIFHLAQFDQTQRVRDLLASRQIYDRQQLNLMPRNRRIVLHGYQRRWLFGRRRTSVAVASVFSPLEACLDRPDQSLPPMGLAELAEHVKSVLVDQSTPHVVAVCSPTGFTDEAKRARLELPNAVLVLVEPTGPGTWRTIDPTGRAGQELSELFDPEDLSQKLARVRQEMASRSAELLSSGLSARATARRLGLQPAVVQRAFREAAQQDPELRLSGQADDLLLLRGASASRQESASMSMVDRIKQLFSRHGDEVKKINLLAERRASLAQRRDRIFEDIGQLEAREAELRQQGIRSDSPLVRRRLAAQLAQLRREIARQNTTAGMLNQQIEIISTHIHNLTLIRQGQAASLPTAEQLTADAVRAEELLEQLRADSELVSSLEGGVAETALTAEESRILKEFEEAAKAQAAEATAAEPPASPPEQARPEPTRQVQPPESED